MLRSSPRRVTPAPPLALAGQRASHVAARARGVSPMPLVPADLPLDSAARPAPPRPPGPATGPGGPECFARSGPLAGDAQGEVMVVEDGAVASAGGRIVAVGRTADVR